MKSWFWYFGSAMVWNCTSQCWMLGLIHPIPCPTRFPKLILIDCLSHLLSIFCILLSNPVDTWLGLAKELYRITIQNLPSPGLFDLRLFGFESKLKLGVKSVHQRIEADCQWVLIMKTRATNSWEIKPKIRNLGLTQGNLDVMNALLNDQYFNRGG